MDYIKGNYFIVPNRKQLSGLDPQTQTVFLWLCARADNNGKCFPSLSNLEETCGISRPTLVDRIAILEKIGLIKKTQGSYNKSNSYQICLVKEVNYPSKGDLLHLVKEVNSNNNHLTITKREGSLSFLKDLKEETINEIKSEYGLSADIIKDTAESVVLYCESKGKKYANYKSVLKNWLRKDHKESIQNYKKNPLKQIKWVETFDLHGNRIMKAVKI